MRVNDNSRPGAGPFMFKIEHVGKSKEPIVILDGFHPDLEGLRASAQDSSFSKQSAFYPGLQAPANPAHLQAVSGVLTDIFKDVFRITTGVSLVQCAYSLVTTPEDKLAPIQRLPHIDTPDPGRIALLHYLSGEETGGTAFYRHRRTVLEVLTETTYADYKRSVTEEGQAKPGYMRGSDDRFEMIGKIDAKPNRAILSRSALLHSGYIPATAALSADPKHGRLTLNSFFQAKP